MFSALFAMTLGGILVVHCSGAALGEFRSGIGRGRRGDYPRETMPFRFWAVVCATAAAGAIGVGFLLAGLGMLLALESSDL